MNVLVLVLCVNLVTLANAMKDINYSTILKILKPKQRQADYSNIQETKDPIEGKPIIRGFNMQKPKTSKSLYENPKAWSNDVLSNEATRQSEKKFGTINKKRTATIDNLNDKILKAARNLNRFRGSQRIRNKNVQPYVESGKALKNPDKILGRMFKGITGDIHFQGKKINRKPQNKAADDPSDAKLLSDLLKKLLNRNINNKYRTKHAYFVTQEESQEDGVFQEQIPSSTQNDYRGLKTQGSGTSRRKPLMIIISSAPLHDDKLEMENNAKESMEVSAEKYGSFDAPNKYPTRRSKADIGSEQSSSFATSYESEVSSYERNPGNPFTVHKNKYKQNWPYNHYMDGDHMNINPLGPKFGTMGPTGPELFFGRKWWYFNQDDFKPMS